MTIALIKVKLNERKKKMRNKYGTETIEEDQILVDRKMGALWIYLMGMDKPLVYAFNPKNKKHNDIDKYYSNLLNVNKVIEKTW